MIGAIDANTTLISALALVQLLVSSSLVVYTIRTQRKVQAAETSIRCQERYEQLLDTRSNIKDADEADRYYDRFWGAQSDQFIHWRNGLIPEETYIDWMQARRRSARTSKAIQGIDFKSAWRKRYEYSYKGSAFGEFMRMILEGGPVNDLAQDYPHVRKAIKKYRTTWL